MSLIKSSTQPENIQLTISSRKMNYFLFHLCLLVVAQSLIVSGYLNSINTTLERRYKLTSKEIGFIYMTYEFTCIPTTIILSIVGRSINRPRLLGISGIVMALGIFLFSLPHFIGSKYELVICNENSTKILCNYNEKSNKVMCPTKNTDRWALCIFCLSQLLLGIGASPIYILGPTYLWDNLSTKMYSIYSSAFYTCSGLGPPIGFLLGGLFLGIYIDIPIYSKCKNMDNTHPLWLGAWWIGPVVVAGITIIVVFPLLTFHEYISISKKIREISTLDTTENNYGGDEELKGSQMKKVQCQSDIPIQKSKILLKSKLMTFIFESFYNLGKLFSNSVWFLITLTAVIENIIVQACATFISKYLQVVYNVPANHASYIVGGIVVPAAIAGVAFGGFIMNKLQPSITTAIKIIIIILTLSGLTNLILMFLGCENIHVVGVSVGYSNVTTTTKYNLVSECNYLCNCIIENYEPVCDRQMSRNYYSPCYAGCRLRKNISKRNFAYTSCSCTNTDILDVGKCPVTCSTYYFTLVIIFMMVFFTATGQIPINIITLSSVAVEHSPMALGVQVFMIRVFAFIPVPLCFGALFDFVCLVRIKDKCNNGSICREYNLHLLSYIWLGTTMIIKLFSIALVISTYLCAKKKQMKKINNTKLEIRNIKFKKEKLRFVDKTNELAILSVSSQSLHSVE